MKRILIVNNNMHIGGVQKALASLLSCIHDRYEVTLALFHPAGELLKDIPEGVKILPIRSSYRFLGMTKYDVENKPLWKLQRSAFAAISRLFGRSRAIALMALGQKKLSGYDVAISYLHNSGDKVHYGGCNDFVLRHVDATKKVTFLHCDYTRCGADTPENAKQYARFDAIAACSQGCADAFLQANPSLKDKVQVVYNCHCFDKLRADAKAAPAELYPDKLNIVTVARLGKEKGVERALEAIGRLGPLKEKLHYYVIGDGIQKPLLLQSIRQKALSQCVTLCGEMANPYGYMAAADLLLIPSYSEAAPLVIGEAAGLGTPVLSTETSSAREMIRQTGFGWVCENSVEGMESMLRALLEDPQEIPARRQALHSIQLDNDQAVAQFAKLTE